MTAMVSAATRTIIRSNSYGTLTSTVGLVAVMLLVVLLLQKELLRTATTPRARAGGDMLNIAIPPLLLAFAVIVTLRVVTLWQSH